MASFFTQTWNRLRGKTPPADFAVTQAAPPPEPARPPTPAHHGVSPAALGARRPVVCAGGSVVGFEFRIRPEVQARLARSPNLSAQTAYATTLLASARLTAADQRLGLVRLPLPWLHPAMAEQVRPGMLLALEASAGQPPQPAESDLRVSTILALRENGAKVGWPAELNLTLRRDFVLVRQGDRPMAEVLAQMAGWPDKLTGQAKLLTDVAHLDDLELALANGIDHATGALAQREAAAPADALPLPPQTRRIGALLQLIVQGADTAALVEEIKADVGLSYRMLRRIKAADLAHLEDCASVEQAVQLLGRNELYRWLSILLLGSPGKRRAGQALQEIALWRARFLELMAIERGLPQPGQLFALGLASMLGPLLGISRQDVADTLHLSAPGSQALLENTGPWAPYLQVVQGMESQSGDAAPGPDLNGEAPLNLTELSEQAWQWASRSVTATREA